MTTAPNLISIPSEAQVPSLSVTGPCATITLNRPARRNSLDDGDLRTLLSHFGTVNTDTSVRVLVLTAQTTGQPRPVFCSGYHVGGFDSGEHDPFLFEKVPDALERMRPITLCALNGSIYGGATDLLLACDLRIGLQGTEFRMPAAALGLHYYPSGLRRYVSRLGLNMAKRAFLAAQVLKCEQLEALGLFEQLVSAEEFDATVSAWVDKLVGLAPLALQATKQSLNEIAAGQFDEPAMRERERITTRSHDFAEGRKAFAERRHPHFEGR